MNLQAALRKQGCFFAYERIKGFFRVNLKFADTKPGGKMHAKKFRKSKSFVLLCKDEKSNNSRKNTLFHVERVNIF